MKFKKFGSNDLPTIIISHGGGLSWWSIENIINTLKSEYYFISVIKKLIGSCEV